MDRPFIMLDPRAGSKALKPYLEALGAQVDDSRQIDADMAFAGYGPDGVMPIGIEYKLTKTGDIFSSLQDGRLTGTQLPRMLATYPRRYLLIEGATRMAEDGSLEISPKPGLWTRPQGRGSGSGSAGWSAYEYWSRLAGLTEFFSEPNTPGRTELKETHNRRESAGWIISMWRRWQKPYESHASHRQWDRSRSAHDGRAGATHQGLEHLQFIPTSSLPIVQRFAREVDGIGQGYSGYVAKHFASPAEMVLADEQEWRKVECLQRLKAGGYRKIHFSAERIRNIRQQLWGGKL